MTASTQSDALAAARELTSAIEEVQTRIRNRSRALSEQAACYCAARRCRELAREVAAACEAMHEAEQERLWQTMAAADINSVKLTLEDEGECLFVRTYQVFPGFNPELVPIGDAVARAHAQEKILDFFRQTGDYEDLVDETPHIVWTRARRKEYYHKWLTLESQGKLAIPPELDLHPKRIISLRRG